MSTIRTLTARQAVAMSASWQDGVEPTGPAFGRPDDKLRDTHHFVAARLSSLKHVGATDQFIVEGDATGFARAQPIL
jgi:hypothetical protein